MTSKPHFISEMNVSKVKFLGNNVCKDRYGMTWVYSGNSKLSTFLGR